MNTTAPRTERRIHYGNALSWAIFSDDKVYRYELGRIWAPSLKKVAVFCMLNPSKADHERSDLTVTKCVGFATRWGCGGLIVVNAFALVSTDPKMLLTHAAPVGQYNDLYISKWIELASKGDVIAAWGAPLAQPRIQNRICDVRGLYGDWQCLGMTKKGHPKHPSRIGYDSERIPLERKAS